MTTSTSTTPRLDGAGPDTVSALLRQIADVGRDRARGGYSRPVYGDAELTLREWFVAAAEARGLDVETDGNGIIWAWWSAPGQERENAVATGSHLDSVPGGGPFDGPLGVASALVAVDELRRRGVTPARPIVIAVFPEEEGSRFGVATLGSRLLTGAITPERALALKDAEGDTLADVLARSAHGAQGTHGTHGTFGRDDTRLRQLGLFVELHVEQGLGLQPLGEPIAVGASILGHGRWLLRLTGQGNHAGTTLMQGRQDPVVAASRIVVSIRDLARATDGARATVGRVEATPGGTNVIASKVEVSLDVRHPDDAVTAALVQRIATAAELIAAEEGCAVTLTEQSLSPTVAFDAGLRDRLLEALPGVPVLDTGAGHDAGILASDVPTAMIFVRNPTGISHSPEELIEDSDAERGAAALADALQHLAGPSAPATVEG
ncbi:allantoate amidohydrolase [Frondihabitans australicus]|uniref:N-carbamoyl-L-amino-acid hydrolase n=1 Tax=Frondihabitans australicus TaxID=386892 RepID=A0A495IC40_9MICO|nr:allantoate amidohydrolase [Frondihabitans australicus]RKR73567.1 N-carbamoyl-L-amino-acid hydrolase [Frondihabitans australicus]